MSLQSGRLSHRYSIRIHVPSPHLCSSGMQGLMLGVTVRNAEGRGEGVTDMQAKAETTAQNHTDVTSLQKYINSSTKPMSVLMSNHNRCSSGLWWRLSLRQRFRNQTRLIINIFGFSVDFCAEFIKTDSTEGAGKEWRLVTRDDWTVNRTRLC